MKKTAIIGLGSQAKAWALNLRDSGVHFSIGLRKDSQSKQAAVKMGFDSFNYQTDAKQFTHFVLLTPDETHQEIVKEIYSQNPEASFIYAHGFSLIHKKINEDFNKASHILLAPKSIASELRFEYETGGKVPAVYSFEYNLQDDNIDYINELARNIGITCFKEATFFQETCADLFSEQTILCSALPYLANMSFETLVAKGIPKELAYFECFHEIKSISSALVKLGPTEFFKLISPNALLGAQIGKEQLFGDELLKKIQSIYQDIEDQKFFKEVESTDFSALRSKVLDYWQNSELNDTHQQLKSELY